MLSVYRCSLFLSVDAVEGAVKQMLPLFAEKLHLVIDLTGASAALNGRGLREEMQLHIPASPLCS